MSNQVRQSPCPLCGLPARPGSAIVMEYGAGGRAHKECLALAQNSVRTSDPFRNARQSVEAN